MPLEFAVDLALLKYHILEVDNGLFNKGPKFGLRKKKIHETKSFYFT